MHRCFPYSNPLFKCWATRSHWLNPKIPHVFRPSCSRKCRRPVSAKEVAALRPLARPPTNANAPRPSPRISTSPSCDPTPETKVTGSPARRISAWARVRQWIPP